MRMRRTKRIRDGGAGVGDGFSEWVASLPYVHERPHFSSTVMMFNVDCPPLERDGTWLVVEHATQTSSSPTRITAVLPRRRARRAQRARLGVRVGEVLPDQVLFIVDPLA